MRASDIKQARLWHQQVAQSTFAKAKDLVGYMGAVQAQDYAMSKWAIGVRVPGSTEQDIEKALNNGQLLRIHVLRPTWHIIAAEDVYWMLAISADKIKALIGTMDRQLELTEKIFSKSNSIIEKYLAQGNHLTREEIAARLNKAKIHTTENRLSHLLLRAELEGIVCNGKSTGNKKTYALLEHRVPKKKTIDKNESLALLAKKYFNSHGPATLQDFAWWSGLTLTDARHGLEANQSKLQKESLQGKEYWFANERVFPTKGIASVHFLPAYDEYIISYKDRTAMLSLDHHKKVLSSNGIFYPVIVVNGQVVGTWKRSFHNESVIVQAAFFVPPAKTLLAKARKALTALAAFYGKKAVLEM